MFKVIYLILQSWQNYRKNPKILDTWKFDVINFKVEQDGYTKE